MRFLIVASAVLVLSASNRRAGAQTVETPIAFDSPQRVTAVTPALAERLHLATPVWPVLGDYREVRLYRASPYGGFVLVAARRRGAFERFALQADQVTALGAAIDAAVAATGRPSGDLGAGERATAGIVAGSELIGFPLGVVGARASAASPRCIPAASCHALSTLPAVTGAPSQLARRNTETIPPVTLHRPSHRAHADPALTQTTSQ